ncbi:MAG: PASTA domain-containing protein, partial [Gammaproteobacteria bacterium]|nr:PASTA domain-containing protein [Gammaproteobacteria bacterium]
VSSGPVIVTVPSVIGLTQASAENAITSAGLTIGNVTTASSETVAAGNVISQTPTDGSSVEEGTSVNLVVSTGPALVTVPSVVGSSYSTAVTAIENAGLVVGNVSTVTTRRSCGRVNSQTPSGGTNVPPGTAVDLVVTRTRFCNPL